MNQARPPTPARPGVVTASSFLLCLYTLIQVISLALPPQGPWGGPGEQR